MKKPNITEGEWKSFSSIEAHDLPTEICRIGISYYVMTDGDPSETAEQDAKAISAVPEMIDALVVARKEIHKLLHEFETHKRPIEKLVKQNEACMQIDEALESAGVEL